jgi:hypothetical protein
MSNESKNSVVIVITKAYTYTVLYKLFGGLLPEEIFIALNRGFIFNSLQFKKRRK